MILSAAKLIIVPADIAKVGTTTSIWLNLLRRYATMVSAALVMPPGVWSTSVRFRLQVIPCMTDISALMSSNVMLTVGAGACGFWRKADA